TGDVVDRQRETGAIAIALQAGLVEQLVGLVEIERVILDIGGVERAVGVDRSGGGAAAAEQQLVGDEFAVEGIGDGLAHALVIERLLGQVELEPVERADAGIALVGNREMRL